MLLPYLYLPAMLLFSWLFLREPCDYPWSRIRKIQFAILLLFTQAMLIRGFERTAAFEVNMKARGTAQGYVHDVRDALGQEGLSARDVCARLEEKFHREEDLAEKTALRKTLLVRVGIAIAGLFLLWGVLLASGRFRMRTLPFLLLFYGCAAGNCVADFYLGESVSACRWYFFRYAGVPEVNSAVCRRILSCEDRLALRLAFEDVCDFRGIVWAGMETDDPEACYAMCEKMLSVLDESLKKYGPDRDGNQ